jgi:dTDP-4-amino-4,6-dideoxygalactose transaminase
MRPSGPIPFSRVVCDGAELEYVRDVIGSGWLTTGSVTNQFESLFRERVGAAHALAVSSGTAALHLALEALGIGPGDRVLVPTMTFTATAEAVRYLDAEPVLLDVEEGTNLLTPAIVREALEATPGVKAVVVVHFGGQAAVMAGDAQGPGILDVAREHGVRVVEDAAHAFPARSRGRMIGTFGDATCFSFYANKTITTGEGGMLVTDREEISSRARIMRLHGIDRDAWARFSEGSRSWEYDVVAPGFKYNLPDLAAALGVAQLERADQLRRERQRCADLYCERLAGLEGLNLPVCHGPREEHAWHLFWIVLNQKSPVRRDRFLELMREAGIATSVHYKPLHRMSYYRDRYDLQPWGYPVAERHWRGAVSLPIYPSLPDGHVEYVCQTIREIVEGS